MPPTPACTGTCDQHGRLCDLDPGHADGHECTDCPGYQRRQHTATIAERVATHKQLRDHVIAPDED